jgi:hypothetical protein
VVPFSRHAVSLQRTERSHGKVVSCLAWNSLADNARLDRVSALWRLLLAECVKLHKLRGKTIRRTAIEQPKQIIQAARCVGLLIQHGAADRLPFGHAVLAF